ncbi:hypothetical protein AHAS_Ahas08G0023600 [Arachis hypogaea]
MPHCRCMWVFPASPKLPGAPGSSVDVNLDFSILEFPEIVRVRCSPSYIHDMMSTLSKNNSVEKLAEIDLIGFRFLRLVPNWSVKQAMMVHLAESYQVKPRTFILDIGNIRLNAELIRKIVQWMCSTFNDSESLRFKDDFYCIPFGILVCTNLWILIDNDLRSGTK